MKAKELVDRGGVVCLSSIVLSQSVYRRTSEERQEKREKEEKKEQEGPTKSSLRISRREDENPSYDYDP